MGKYNSHPLGQLKPEHQRQEPDMLIEKGYKFKDARDIVDLFENKVANHFGSKYAVATDCCTNAIFLCLQYLLYTKWIKYGDTIAIPNHTYISVPMQIILSGLQIEFINYLWEGKYYLANTNIIDSAVFWQKDGYVKDSLMCLSFQIKKNIPVGKMGAILTDCQQAYDWLKLASYDGRDLKNPYDSGNHIKMIGWHYYATPEDCARAILLMDDIEDKGCYVGSENYPNCEIMLKNIKQ